MYGVEQEIGVCVCVCVFTGVICMCVDRTPSQVTCAPTMNSTLIFSLDACPLPLPHPPPNHPYIHSHTPHGPSSPYCLEDWGRLYARAAQRSRRANDCCRMPSAARPGPTCATWNIICRYVYVHCVCIYMCVCMYTCVCRDHVSSPTAPSSRHRLEYWGRLYARAAT